MIESFTADIVELTDGRHQITYAWRTSGASSVSIWLHTRSRFVPGWMDLPPSGTHVVESDPLRPNPDTELIAYNPEGGRSEEILTLTFPCRYPYFFTTETEIDCDPPGFPDNPCTCPRNPPRSVQAVEQLFENGRMILLPGDGLYRDRIMVFFNNSPSSYGHEVRVYEDTWTPNEPEHDPELTPPAGRYQPVRSLGTLWRENADARRRLGWATAPEQSFEFVWQQLGTEGYGTTILLRTADDEIILFSGFWTAGGSWYFLSP